MPPQTKGIASGRDLGTGTSKLVRNERDKERVRERLEERSHDEDKRCKERQTERNGGDGRIEYECYF